MATHPPTSTSNVTRGYSFSPGQLPKKKKEEVKEQQVERPEYGANDPTKPKLYGQYLDEVEDEWRRHSR